MPVIDISQYKSKRTVESKPAASLFNFLQKDISFSSGQFADKKKEAFYLELSTLLQSGIDLKTALELTLVDHTNKKELQIFEDIKEKVIEGMSLSEAIRSTAKFGNYEYFSISIGEETGKLAEVLAELGLYYKNRIQQKRKIISAVTYPVIVLSTSVGAILFMINFVVPMFADVFKRFGTKLPWITQFILDVAAFFDHYFGYFFIVVVLSLIFFMVNRKTEWFRKSSSAAVLRLPLIGDLVRKIYLARLANTMRLLVSTDIPLLRAIGLVRQMINYYPIEHSLQQVEADILHGQSLHGSLGAFSFYPPKLVQLIKIGEEVNRLDYFFEKLSSQYTQEVEYRTNAISSMMEPLIIIFLGLVVGVILIAMYLPMFQMSNSF